MVMDDMVPIVAAVLTFASVALFVYVVAQYYTADARMRRRLRVPAHAAASVGG